MAQEKGGVVNTSLLKHWNRDNRAILMAQLWHNYVLILDIAQGFRKAGKSLINKANWRKVVKKII